MKSLLLKAPASLLICALFFSCAHTEQLENDKIQSSRKIRSLETDLRKKQAAINNLKEQNWILKQKYSATVAPAANQKVPVPFQPSASMTQPEESSKIVSNALPAVVSPPVIVQAPTPKVESSKVEEALATDSRESAEHNLYAKVIANYRQKRSADLKRVTEILLKTYPQSVFADRAIFLNARLDFENANDPAALSECEKIIRNYPNANKLVATYFLKAQILKKQGHLLEAKSVLADVQNYFPGSPESYRVPLELKLLSLQAKATK